MWPGKMQHFFQNGCLCCMLSFLVQLKVVVHTRWLHPLCISWQIHFNILSLKVFTVQFHAFRSTYLSFTPNSYRLTVSNLSRLQSNCEFLEILSWFLRQGLTKYMQRLEVSILCDILNDHGI